MPLDVASEGVWKVRVVDEKRSILRFFKLQLHHVCCLDRPFTLRLDAAPLLEQSLPKMKSAPIRQRGHSLVLTSGESSLHLMVTDKMELTDWANALQVIASNVVSKTEAVTSRAQFEMDNSGEASSLSSPRASEPPSDSNPLEKKIKKWGRAIRHGWVYYRKKHSSKWKKSFVLLTPHCILIFFKVLLSCCPLADSTFREFPNTPLVFRFHSPLMRLNIRGILGKCFRLPVF